jgi:hypothetical protein
MKALLRVTMGVLLTELMFGFLTHALLVTTANGTQTSAPVLPGWRLGAPVVFENLTVFPVIGNDSFDASKFITLEEGLRSGKVTLTEIGASGRRRRIRPGQEASDDADVNKLLITNRTGKTMILIAGEIVVGGKQDRIVGQDCLVASGPRAVPIEVFCVEPGRWNEDAVFGQSRDVEQSSDTISSTPRRGRRRSGRVSGVAGGVAGGLVGGVAGGEPGGLSFAPAYGLIAPSNVREKAQASKDQSGVWDEVAKTEAANNTSSATGNLNAVFENKQVSARLEDYDRAFQRKLTDNNIVGVVVAVAGKLRSADVFAAHSLFLHYWPKLLKSYSLEASSARKTEAKSVDVSEAETFLTRATGTRSVVRKGRYRLVEHQTDEVASFELVNTTSASSPVIHFNRVRKQ